VDFDAFYALRSAKAQPQKSTASILVISADGKGVVMLPRDLRESIRKRAQKATFKLEKRLTKGEKRDRKRMATVATVYTVAPHERTPEDVVRSMAPHEEAPPSPRPRPENKRVRASLEKSAEPPLPRGRPLAATPRMNGLRVQHRR